MWVSDQSFGLLDVFMAEKELAIEIAQIDCVEIHDMHFSESSEDKVLKQFAPNPSSSDH